jgi:hypothetical protein
MDDSSSFFPKFPEDLVEWAGHHSGGVKRLFDSYSGRPGKELLRTNLITRLESWAIKIAQGSESTPRIILLVGGPGNGKTEAIEHTINCLDQALAAEGKLVDELSQAFHPEIGKAVARVVRVEAGVLAANQRQLQLSIVQDASATAGQEGASAPELLIQELTTLLDGPETYHYLCCVNRGVLDDALIHALDNNLNEACALLETITRSVSLSFNAPSCWPLHDYPSIAVWPMDAESLLVSPDGDVPSPASMLLSHATNSEYWPNAGECPAGSNCPFCDSQALLAREEHRNALLKVLRWYELSSGKRWSFRDLFSLMSYLLAGNRPPGHEQQRDPCSWAVYLIELDKSGQLSKNPRREQLTSIFYLATSSYQHALFHRWDPEAAASLRHD